MPSKARDAFRTISEVADWLDVPAHVLRFWESKFSQIKPVKRAGGRRYYRPDDMLLIGGIKKLLHDDGMTIRGVQKMLKEDGVKVVSGLSQTLEGVDAAASPRTQRRKTEVPDEDDAVAETAPQQDVVEEAETIAAWDADAQAEDTPSEEAEQRPAMHVEPEAAADSPEPEAEEITEDPEHVADNVVAMPPREEADVAVEEPADATPAEPEPELNLAPEDEPEAAAEAEPEPEAKPEIATQETVPPETIVVPDPVTEEPPEVAAQDTTPPEPSSDPQPEPERPIVQLDPNRENTLPPMESPTAEPVPSGPSDDQIAARALKRRLRGTDPTKLAAAPGLGAQVARLSALRDRLAAQVADN